MTNIALQQQIKGAVVDENGNRIAGASIRVKSSPNRVISSDAKGEFVLPITALNEIIIVTFLGYEPYEFKAQLSPKQVLIKLKKQDSDLEEVVITGMMERKRDSFTGATSSFSGEELKMVNNQNVIASLRALDPAFIQIENNAAGSNPNILPTIELRGQTSISSENLRDEFMSDPNQPLFILDGFETNLRTIMDLDMNIIQSVTILKDAASTATYGSRASNGVVVVETIKPKQGKIRLSYTSDLKIEFPDLNTYNMMDAEEKLEFERLSNRYYSSNVDQQLQYDWLYNERLANVLRGVNTYWLDKPLQTGFAHRHSVSARGGEGSVVFDAGVNFKDTKGTMIGSDRNDWGANFNLNYRSGKLNISNRAFVSGYVANESPYRKFSSWVRLNPYYELKSADEKYIISEKSPDGNFTNNVGNPFYNANIGSFDRTKNYVLSNNFQLVYTINPSWRLTANAQISKGITDDNNFLSPRNTFFDMKENAKKGELEHKDVSTYSYTANAMATFSKVYASIHALTGNLRAEINETNNMSLAYKAVGFPYASNGNPSFAYGFETDSKPQSSTKITRRNSIVASANYSYNQKYNVDANYNLDGSTSFGSEHLYSPYYSFGVSWNVHKEAFISSLGWVNNLRLRANTGVTGNQNFGNISQSVYDYIKDINRFGQGVYLSAMGAPDRKSVV